MCLPFSVSPLALPEIVKSLSNAEYPEIRIAGGPSITYNPQSLDVPVLAAMPLLIPVYLIRYDPPDAPLPEPITLVVGAMNPDLDSPFVAAYSSLDFLEFVNPPFNLFRNFSEIIRRLRASLTTPHDPQWIYATDSARDESGRAIQVDGASLNTLRSEPSETGLTRNAPLKSTLAHIDWAASTLSLNSLVTDRIDWDDLRVRPYSQDEREELTAFFLRRFVHSQVKQVQELIQAKESTDEGPKVQSVLVSWPTEKNSGGPKVLTKLEDIKKELESFEETEAEQTPQWYKDWTNQQQKKKQ